MRSFKGPGGGPVALAALFESGAKFILDLGRRARGKRRFEPPFERDRSPREGAFAALRAHALDQRHEPAGRIEPCGGDRRARFRHLLLEPLEQSARPLPHLEQPVPLPHRPVVAAKRAPHLGIDGKHEPVEKAPPLGGGTGEQTVHGRDEPDQIDIFGESARALLFAGDAHGPAGRLLARAGGKAGADLDLVLARHHSCRDGEAAGAVFAAKLAIGASAQAVPRTEQRNGLDQIGLARAIVADEHHGPRIQRELGPRIIAEIGELQGANKQPGLGGVACDRLDLALSLATSLHTRIGMST